MRSLILAISVILCLNSCVTYQPGSTTEQLAPIPPTPILKEYSRKPIIEKKENDFFLVSDEFVENSILLKKYSDKIKTWQEENKIK